MATLVGDGVVDAHVDRGFCMPEERMTSCHAYFKIYANDDGSDKE